MERWRLQTSCLCWPTPCRSDSLAQDTLPQLQRQCFIATPSMAVPNAVMLRFWISLRRVGVLSHIGSVAVMIIRRHGIQALPV